MKPALPRAGQFKPNWAKARGELGAKSPRRRGKLVAVLLLERDDFSSNRHHVHCSRPVPSESATICKRRLGQAARRGSRHHCSGLFCHCCPLVSRKRCHCSLCAAQNRRIARQIASFPCFQPRSARSVGHCIFVVVYNPPSRLIAVQHREGSGGVSIHELTGKCRDCRFS